MGEDGKKVSAGSGSDAERWAAGGEGPIELASSEVDVGEAHLDDETIFHFMTTF